MRQMATLMPQWLPYVFLVVMGGGAFLFFDVRGNLGALPPPREEVQGVSKTCLQKVALPAALEAALPRDRAPPPDADPLQGGCPPVRPIDPPRVREDIGKILRRLNLTGVGVEIGVQQGHFTKALLSKWQVAKLYVQVDVWEKQSETYKDSANVDTDEQIVFQHRSCKNAEDAQAMGFAKSVVQCRGTSVDCAMYFPDGSLDFVYVDARHDRKGVLEDMKYYWPKLREGGIMAGHDYLFHNENIWKGGPMTFHSVDPSSSNDYRLNFDGTIDYTNQVVRGAANDFFAGVAEESPEELRTCPRQVVVTYREAGIIPAYSGQPPTWVVRK